MFGNGCDNYITINENGLSVEEKLKPKCSKIDSIIIQGKILDATPSEICQVLPNLKKFTAPSLSIKNISQTDLSDCENLEELYLSANQLETLEVGVFVALKKLKILDLTSNLLNHLIEGCFDGLSALTDLLLAHNCLTCLPVTILSQLSNLKELRLDNNNLHTLELSMFDYNQNLKSVVLHMNYISTIKPTSAAVSIEELYLHNNDLSDISNLQCIKNVKILNLSDNPELMLENDSFSNFKQLIKLFLNNVTLSRFDNFYKFFASLQNLESISIGSNNLDNIAIEKFETLKSLQTFNIENNKLKSIDYEMLKKYFKNLKKIRIDKNLFEITDDFKYYLSNNQIDYSEKFIASKTQKQKRANCQYECKIVATTPRVTDNSTIFIFISALIFFVVLIIDVLVIYSIYFKLQKNQ
jgi:insulin-like growth factor-binding protein complex acid labile subunit